MFRTSLRVATVARSSPRIQQAGRRFASTIPSRSGTFKGTLARWGIAGAIVYYYNTSTVFADEPQNAIYLPAETDRESETYSSIDAIAEQRRAQSRQQAQVSQQKPATTDATSTSDAEPAAVGGAGELEEEAQQQGAFNEETGEINWDCPCLGGMAHGVCGDQFRAAFSCFVYSKEEPKGVDCIDKFQAMQNCFREHPEIYGSELEDDDELAPTEDIQTDGTPAPASASTSVASEQAPEKSAQSPNAATKPEQTEIADDESHDELVPKAWHADTSSGPAKQ